MAGDLLVYQQGTAATPTSGNAGVPINIVEVTPGGSVAQTFSIPTTSLVTDSAGSEGDLSLSDNGTLLSFTGYTGGSVSNETNNPGRAVGTLDANGNFATPGAGYSNAVAGTQTRGAYSADGVNYYMTDKTGVFYNGGNGNLTGSVNTRDIKAFGGSTYILTANTGNKVVSLITPASPQSGTVTVSALPGAGEPTDANAVDFALLSSLNTSTPDTLYFTDTTGIVKYADISNVWTLEGTIGGLGKNVSGLTAAADPNGGVDLYYTNSVSSVNTLDEITDSANFNAAPSASAATILYTAPTGDDLRGVSLAPVPEPSSAAVAAIGGLLMLRGRRPRR
jgi:hypothetical protein